MNQRIIAHLSLTWLFFVQLIPYNVVRGCGSGGSQKRDDRRITLIGQYYTFLDLGKIDYEVDSEAFGLTKGVSIAKGERIYGRVDVPYVLSGPRYILSVGAFWHRDDRWNSPIWMYLRRQDLPTDGTWDKSSVTWMRQRMTKLHLSFPRAGVYWVMIRGDDRAKVTIAVNILPKDHPEAGDPRYLVPEGYLAATTTTTTEEPQLIDPDHVRHAVVQSGHRIIKYLGPEVVPPMLPTPPTPERPEKTQTVYETSGKILVLEPAIATNMTLETGTQKRIP